MARTVLLHVGTPKTGTSYLQDVLFRSRRELQAAGILYPADRFDAHFLAGLDLMQLPWGGLETEAIGAWDDLAGRVRAHRGTAIISHEILASASRPQIERALDSLGAGEGTEIHVLLSVRDLVRQIPAEWQENVKHRSTISYEAFLAQLAAPDRTGRVASWFWSVQEIPDILDRWAADLPAEQVHVITVPPPGGPADLLWQRFSAAFGLDGLALRQEAIRANPSLGVPETALVRRINQAANNVLEPRHYRPLVRELLAHQTLSRRTGSPRLALPPGSHAWALDLSIGWAEEIRARGYDVVGDLADLAGAPVAVPWTDPAHPDEAQVADAAVDALRAVLLETARLREREEQLTRELDDAHRALERAYLRPTYRWREKTVRRLQSGRLGQRLLALYRSARGRSSLSA